MWEIFLHRGWAGHAIDAHDGSFFYLCAQVRPTAGAALANAASTSFACLLFFILSGTVAIHRSGDKEKGVNLHTLISTRGALQV